MAIENRENDEPQRNCPFYGGNNENSVINIWPKPEKLLLSLMLGADDAAVAALHYLPCSRGPFTHFFSLSLSLALAQTLLYMNPYKRCLLREKYDYNMNWFFRLSRSLFGFLCMRRNSQRTHFVAVHSRPFRIR